MARHGSAETADPAISEANGESAARLGLRMQFWSPAETAGIAEDARWRVKAAQKASGVTDDWKQRRLGAFRGLGQRICEAFPGLGLKAACFDELIELTVRGCTEWCKGFFPRRIFASHLIQVQREWNSPPRMRPDTKNACTLGSMQALFLTIKNSAIRPEHRPPHQEVRLPVRLQSSWKSVQGWPWAREAA